MARHFCGQCGAPAPLGSLGVLGRSEAGDFDPANPPQRSVAEEIDSAEDFFTAFGLAPKFQVETQELEKRFFALSRTLHPDRFSNASAAAKQASLARMTWINVAYDTLRDHTRARDYRVQQLQKTWSLASRGGEAGVAAAGVTKDAGIPTQFVEQYFTLMDLVLEDPQQGALALGQMLDQLQAHEVQAEAAMQRLEARVDEGLESQEFLSHAHALLPQILGEIKAQLREQGYVCSLLQQLKQMQKRLGVSANGEQK